MRDNDNQLNRQQAATLQQHIIELLKDVASLKGSGLRSKSIIGGIATLQAASNNRYLRVEHRDGEYVYTTLTQAGLELVWENSITEDLVSRPVADY